MIFLVALLILAGVGFYVAYPLWRARPNPSEETAGPENNLLAQKELTYQALKELEFDYALGNLSPQDHQELEEKYKDKAVSILKQMDVRGRRVERRSLEEDVEAEILKLRRRQARPLPTPSKDAPQKTSVPPQPMAETCLECGAGIRAGARYCPSCGASLQALLCPKCATPYKRQDRFCSQCGAALSARESRQ